MDTKALRQKILDLAIRGKLVPQDPNDEPASVLLERIRAEKQQMVKDGKLKAKNIKNDTVIFKGEDSLHYEKFADGTVKCIENEIPFELPNGWEWCKLFQISEIVTGSTPSKKNPEYYGESFPFFKPTDLEQGANVINASEYLSIKGKNVSREIPIGSTAVCCIGSIGKCGYLQREGATNQQINSIIPYIHKKYVFYYCLTNFFVEQLLIESSATTIAIVNKNKMSNVFIPIPPIKEQDRITVKLTELFSFIDTIESNKTDLQSTIQLTKSKILDLAIRGKLVPQDPNDEPASVLIERIKAEKEELIRQGKIKRDKKESVIFRGEDNSYYETIGSNTTNIDDEIPFELPNNWSIMSISQGNLFQTVNITPMNNKNKKFELYSVPNYEYDSPEILAGSEIGSTKQKVENDDVLLCKINPRINRVWIVRQITEYQTIASSEWIVFRNKKLYSHYIRLYFSSPLFRDLLLTNVSGVGGSLMRAQPDSVKKYPIFVPPLNEQKRIADKVSQLFSILDTISSSLD